MKPGYLTGVEILTPQRRLLDYGILEASTGSLELLTTRFKGTVLGGGILLMFSSVYWFLVALPFVFLHVSPITYWDPVLAALFVVAVPVTFFAFLFSSIGLVRRVQVKYRKTFRRVSVSNIEFGRFRHVMTVQADRDNLILIASGRRSRFEHALELAGELNLKPAGRGA